MQIYSEAFKLVVYIPADAKAGNTDRVCIWMLPGFDRSGENDAFGIDNDFNRPAEA